MAIKDSLKGLLTNVKARTLVIFVVVILVVGIAIVFFSGKKKEQITNAGGQAPVSSVEKINKNIRYVPGGTAPPEYYEMQYQENKQRANVATEKGTSALPTIVAEQFVSNVPSLEKKPEEPAPQVDQAAEAQKRLLTQQAEAQRQQQMLEREQANAELEQRQNAYEQLMAAQAAALFAAWTPPQQAYVGGSVTEAPADGGQGGGRGNQEQVQSLYKAGDILYAVLETSINTDEPGPILAKIVSGPLKDSRIIGNLTIAGEYAQKVMLQFSIINVPDMPTSLGFSAVAIDPDTARTAIASDVDNHYFLRYGTLFAASFMEGMSDAILASISNPGFEVDANGVIVGSSVTPTIHDQVVSGFGKVGEQIGEQTDFFNRPPTITVDSGTAMGILMLQDFSLANSGNKPSGLAGAQPLNAVNTNPFAPAQPQRTPPQNAATTGAPTQGSVANLEQALGMQTAVTPATPGPK